MKPKKHTCEVISIYTKRPRTPYMRIVGNTVTIDQIEHARHKAECDIRGGISVNESLNVMPVEHPADSAPSSTI